MNNELTHRPGAVPRPHTIPVLTTEALSGYRIVEVKGLVRGNTIRARHVGMDFLASLKTLVGGEIGSYTVMLAEAREQALSRLRDEASSLGANAVVGARFTTSTVMQGAAEILAYGTAVVVEKE